MKRGVRAAAAATAAAYLLFTLFPGLDLWMAGWFYDPATGRFVGATDPRLVELRSDAMSVTMIVSALAAVAFLLRTALPGTARFVPGRAAGYLLLTLALGPGLITNVVLKEHWDRPRPDAVLTGKAPFEPWWEPGGACRSNCSFVSGEASAAFWLTGLAVLAPAMARPIVVLALVYGAGVGLLRMAFGRHFLSDVVFAGLASVWVNLLCYRLCFGPLAPLPRLWLRLAGEAATLRRRLLALATRAITR
jgi:membrane-associated phospholipid phosphatase